jgi:3-deoxy-D-manno-octulosonate 8-phosphate phosphatase (KDO 8-P phosphatase)
MTLRERCLGVEALVLDVDGVLTAGGISYASHGGEVDSEVKTFHVRDGSGLKLWHAAGKRSVLITGRSSKIVQVRADELGISRVIQGASDKLESLLKILDEWQLSPSAIACIGDDIPDVPALRMAGLAAAPADACSESRAVAQYVCRASGGCGAVREVIELVLHCQDKWPQ